MQRIGDVIAEMVIDLRVFPAGECGRPDRPLVTPVYTCKRAADFQKVHHFVTARTGSAQVALTRADHRKVHGA